MFPPTVVASVEVNCILLSKEQYLLFLPHVLYEDTNVLLLLLLLLLLSPLYGLFTRMSPRQTMSLGDTLLQLLFCFIVHTVSGAYLPRSYVGSDGLLCQRWF